MASRTDVTNESAGTYTFPLPYSGSLAPGAAAVLTDDEPTVITNLGGAAAIGSSLRIEILNPSTTATSHAALPIGMPVPTVSTSPASKAYVDSAVVAPGAAAGGDLSGTYPNPLLAVYIKGAAQSLSGAGAVDIIHATTKLTSTGAAQALTLANSTSVGQRKMIVHAVDGGSMVLTPTAMAIYTTVTFTNVRDWCELEWNGTAWDFLAGTAVPA